MLHSLRLASLRVSQVTFTLPIPWIFFSSGRCLPEPVRDRHFQAILVWTLNNVIYEVYDIKTTKYNRKRRDFGDRDTCIIL